MKDLNLIPKSYFKNKRKKRKRVLIVSASIMGLLIVVFSFVWPARTEYMLKKKVEEEKKENTKA